jgi:hypothetical protein
MTHKQDNYWDKHYAGPGDRITYQVVSKKFATFSRYG